MRIGVIILAFAMIFIIFLSLGVYAAGGSTGSTSERTQAEARNISVIEPVSSVTLCRNAETRRERIKCRLNLADEEEKEEGLTEESCRGLSTEDRDACFGLYDRSDSCYKMTDNSDKIRCFRSAAGLTTAAISGQAERKAEMRNYVVLLLYELQERLEDSNEEGNVDDDSTAEIIDLIVQIKQDIINKQSRESILPKLQDLKSLVKAVRSGQ